MRKFLNAWLRRWAAASLRQELHQAQDKLIAQLEIRENLVAKHQEHIAAFAKKRKKQLDARAYDTELIKALRARMEDDLFRAIVSHVRRSMGINKED
jgi:hypothetical protein